MRGESSSMAMTVTALKTAVGAVIENIDHRMLDENDFKAVATAYDH